MPEGVGGFLQALHGKNKLSNHEEPRLIGSVGFLAEVLLEAVAFLQLTSFCTHASWDLRSNAPALGSVKGFKTISEVLKRDVLIAQLASLALACYDNTGRKMPNADGCVACVDILPARTTRTKRVNNALGEKVLIGIRDSHEKASDRG